MQLDLLLWAAHGKRAMRPSHSLTAHKVLDILELFGFFPASESSSGRENRSLMETSFCPVITHFVKRCTKFFFWWKVIKVQWTLELEREGEEELGGKISLTTVARVETWNDLMMALSRLFFSVRDIVLAHENLVVVSRNKKSETRKLRLLSIVNVRVGAIRHKWSACTWPAWTLNGFFSASRFWAEFYESSSGISSLRGRLR